MASSASSLELLITFLALVAALEIFSAVLALLKFLEADDRPSLTRVLSAAFLVATLIFSTWPATALDWAALSARNCLILDQVLPTTLPPMANPSSHLTIFQLLCLKASKVLSPPLSTYSFISARALMGARTTSEAPPVTMPRPTRMMITGMELSMEVMVAMAASRSSVSGEKVDLLAKAVPISPRQKRR